MVNQLLISIIREPVRNRIDSRICIKRDSNRLAEGHFNMHRGERSMEETSIVELA